MLISIQGLYILLNYWESILPQISLQINSAEVVISSYCDFNSC